MEEEERRVLIYRPPNGSPTKWVSFGRGGSESGYGVLAKGGNGMERTESDDVGV